MHPIIKELVDKDIQVTIVKAPESGVIKDHINKEIEYLYRIEGFGKSGYMHLEAMGIYKLNGITRYGETYEINNFDDILWIAKEWCEKGVERGIGVSGIWKSFFIEKGWMKKPDRYEFVKE